MARPDVQLSDISSMLDAILHGNDRPIDQLYALSDRQDLSPELSRLLKLISAMVLRSEVAEFRLETIVSDLLQAQAELTKAQLDPLTALPNRGAFNAALHAEFDKAANESQPLGLMFIDLDKFKQVNDTYGHDAGDEVLITAAERMHALLPEGCILARLGGDEFTILLPAFGDYTEATQLADQIRRSLQEPFELSCAQVHIGSSIGISLFPHDCNSAAALLKNADVAMYAAKGSGRNRVLSYHDRHTT